jgi:hypothetical protein
MAKAEASVEELVSMIERGELRLPEMQRRYVWRSTRVRDLMDSLYRGYPSGALEGRNQRSALFKTMFLAFRADGAKDWRSNLNISLDHSGAHHRLQFHHIFPKAQLRKSYTLREADDIANLAFIGGKTNRGISDKAPLTYLPPLIAQQGAQIFDAQAMPTETSLLEVANYKAFLAVRRKRIAARLNEFLTSELAK